jgi:hypothetical protein
LFLRVALLFAFVAGVDAVWRPVEPITGSLTTNDTSYVASRESGGGPIARYGFTLVARYHNPTKAPIYLARCYAASKTPLYDVRLVQSNRSSGSAYSPVWACVGHDKQIVVKPGATRVDTIAISGPATWSGLTKKPIGVLEGRFRLGYSPQSCPGDGKCEIVVDSLRYSNEFTVHLAQ